MGASLATGSFFGKIAGRLDTPGALLTELAHGSGRDLPGHRHEAAYFCLLVRGSYAEEIEGQTFSYRPFSVVFHPPDVFHRDRIGPGGALFFTIELKPDWLARTLETFALGSDFQPRFLEGDLSRLAARLYRLNAGKALDSEVVESALWELVGCVDRERRLDERGRPAWLDGCIDLLRAGFSNPLRVQQVAAAVGVHPVHLSREFRKRFGQTMGQYVHKLRVRAACEQLDEVERPLADIAFENGFSDQSHFCRVFKSLVGCSPGNFRETIVSR